MKRFLRSSDANVSCWENTLLIYQDLPPNLPPQYMIKSVNLASNKEIHYFTTDNLIRN